MGVKNNNFIVPSKRKNNNFVVFKVTIIDQVSYALSINCLFWLGKESTSNFGKLRIKDHVTQIKRERVKNQIKWEYWLVRCIKKEKWDPCIELQDTHLKDYHLQSALLLLLLLSKWIQPCIRYPYIIGTFIFFSIF